MRSNSLLSTLALGAVTLAGAQSGPYKILRTAKVGGDGGFDYVYADPAGRKLYVCRSGANGRVTIFDLDTLNPAREIAKTNGHGVASDAKTNHAFVSSHPVAMLDTKSLTLVKTIDVQGRPDGILNDPFNHRTYVFSHEEPSATVLDDKDGSILGTFSVDGAPEQAASDGRGHLFIDVEDKGTVAVVDAKTMKVTGSYSLKGKSGAAGLALDTKHHVLFVACRDPQVMVMLNSETGEYLADLPIGRGCDGVVFNPKTNEAFASQGDGTLTVIKEDSPTTFSVEQTLTTPVGAKTCTFDPKTGHIFLITAEYGPAPQPATGNGRPRRGAMVPGSFQIIEVGKG